MSEKHLKSGGVAYYWQPPTRDIRDGFPITSTALGEDYAAAQARANELNTALTAWRRGVVSADETLSGRTTGTFAWLFDTYYETDAFERLSERSKGAYRRVIKRALAMTSKEGRPLKEYRLKALTPLAVDRIYQRLLQGKKGTAVRVANFTVMVVKRAWSIVFRQYPEYFPTLNPWTNLERRHKYTAKRAASREEAYALSAALKARGYPHLGLVPLVCYEWHQRPENVLAGLLRWSDWRPAEKPDHVRLEHGKTGAEVFLPLEVKDDAASDTTDPVKLFPEIEAYLAGLEKIGEAIVMTRERGEPHLYSCTYAQRRVREARKDAGLGVHVTFDACRHGGMTELGDADATEAQIMAVSGHRSPEAARRYIKRTERQRVAGLKKRRLLVEQALQRQRTPETEAKAEAGGNGEAPE